MAVTTGSQPAALARPLLEGFAAVPEFFLQPLRLLRGYRREYLRADLIAGLTVAVIMLPQAIAYALVAELPPQVGLYTAIVGAVVAALWGSSNHLQTGPTNAISLLILSALLTHAMPGTAEFVSSAALMALIVGVIQVGMGLARLGVLTNFVSHSVVVGFSAGAGVLIALSQLRHVLGLQFSSHGPLDTLHAVWTHLPETHGATLALGGGAMVLVMLLRRLNRRLPASLIAMIVAGGVVAIGRLPQYGVAVIGELPRGLPPLTELSSLNLARIGQLVPGAFAIAAMGLVETTSIARSLASQSNQRLNSNQEFVGQGLANLAVGLFSGYPCSGSFTRSAVNMSAGAQTRLASAFSGFFVLVAMLILAPFAAYLPRAALSGVLILTALSMINRHEMARILRGARADALIMIATLLATLFLHLDTAVLIGILLSFTVYIIRTSVPRVVSVLPDDRFRHFVYQPTKPPCPQLAIFDILGDLYFGAVSHVEQVIHKHLACYPTQRFLLLRMHSVQHCDYSGIHMLEHLVHSLRDRGGDVFMVRVREPVLDLMRTTGFLAFLGAEHCLEEDIAISHLFYRILDPAICIYECETRAFKECQNLPKADFAAELPLYADVSSGSVVEISARELWQQLHQPDPPLVIDVREAREFRQGHIPVAQPLPFSTLRRVGMDLPRDRALVFVCRGGRRSTRAARMAQHLGYTRVKVLQGGMLAWQAANLLMALEDVAK